MAAALPRGATVLAAAALASSAAAAPPPHAAVPEVVEGLVGEYTQQPKRVPSNQTVGAPILGNGEFGVVIGGTPVRPHPPSSRLDLSET